MTVADLRFEIDAEWTGRGRDGEGTIRAGEETIHYSGPANMGGKGTGTNPEELLLAGVTACYSATLFRVVQQAGLAINAVRIRTEGVVTDYPVAAKFSRLTVHPTIVGGSPSDQDAYVKAAQEARQQCFIGRTVQGYLDYSVGTVTVA